MGFLVNSSIISRIAVNALAGACALIITTAPRSALAIVHEQGPAFTGAAPIGPRGVDALQSGWLQLETRDASTIAPEELDGARFSEVQCWDERCALIEYRVVSMRRDSSRNAMVRFADNGDVPLYELEVRTSLAGVGVVGAGAEGWRNPCGPGERGLFVAGRWRGDGSWVAGGSSFSCLTGAIAKCVRDWGYKPWKSAPTSDGQLIPLGPLHRACVRALRADYCGDGTSHTRTGQLVELIDVYDFNVRSQRVPFFMPEAGFDERGATWVQRVRVRATGRDVAGETVPRCTPAADPVSLLTRPMLIQVWSRTPLTSP